MRFTQPSSRHPAVGRHRRYRFVTGPVPTAPEERRSFGVTRCTAGEEIRQLTCLVPGSRPRRRPTRDASAASGPRERRRCVWRSDGKVAWMVATAVAEEHRVTPRELFFDLVFVFAFTQVATLLAARADVHRDRPRRARARSAVVGVDGVCLADEHRRPGGGRRRCRAARRTDRDVRGGARRAGSIRGRRRALRRRLPRRVRDAYRPLFPRRPPGSGAAPRGDPAGAVGHAQRDADSRRRLHGRRADLALGGGARGHLRRRGRERVGRLAACTRRTSRSATGS